MALGGSAFRVLRRTSGVAVHSSDALNRRRDPSSSARLRMTALLLPGVYGGGPRSLHVRVNIFRVRLSKLLKAETTNQHHGKEEQTYGSERTNPLEEIEQRHG